MKNTVTRSSRQIPHCFGSLNPFTPEAMHFGIDGFAFSSFAFSVLFLSRMVHFICELFAFFTSVAFILVLHRLARSTEDSFALSVPAASFFLFLSLLARSLKVLLVWLFLLYLFLQVDWSLPLSIPLLSWLFLPHFFFLVDWPSFLVLLLLF